MGIIELLQKWCLSILNALVQILRIPFRRLLSPPPPDPQNLFDQLATLRESSSAEPWEIFINHRGSDVKYTFANQIHHILQDRGYRVFLDAESLKPGDAIVAEIKAAMRSASLHVAIFSPNYAQSPWCLDELAFILNTGANVFPIFYSVDPSDLRYLKGTYAQAFSELEKKGRYTQEKLNEWKEALHNISLKHGFHVKNNKDEANVLKKVVNCAMKVFKKDTMWVAEHPVGLDELVQRFNSVAGEGNVRITGIGQDELVQGVNSVAGEDNVKITGIWGMGGSGKTTLAKEIFNRNFSFFDKCSFVADVRDASRNALRDKQKKLLKDLGVRQLELAFDSVDEGKSVLATRLSSARALIVLDDVDHKKQLCALLPNKNKLGSGSMVIVTTREKDVLESWGLSSIYEMPRLEFSYAEQLFCWHAFMQPSPPDGFETLVRNFLESCNGLPLSLEVFGAQLYSKKSKDDWNSLLNEFRETLHKDIKKSLRISYDALEEEEKEMFLDVACFLIGELKGTAIAVWDGMGLRSVRGLQTLVSKCLVELVPAGDREENIFNEEEIRIHDHLRDMGREIASSHSSSYRLWCPRDIDKLKRHFKKEIPIRGIRPPATFQAFKEYKQRFLGISNGLELLHVEGDDITEEFASLSEDLVCLRWDRFPLKNLQPWLTLRHLSFLELASADELEELWQDNVDPPSQLRKLSISMSFQKLERLPTSIGRLERLPTSIRRLQYLKMISIPFGGCSLPEEFCSLVSLEYLHLHCKRLGSLPDDFGNLVKLKYIYLEDCQQLSTLPDSFQKLTQLEDLNLSFCRRLSSLPDGFGNAVNLKHIALRYCTKLSTLPDSFGNLVNLKHIDLNHCYELSELPDSFGDLINLEHLDLNHCYELSKLPVSFGNLENNLKHFNVIECRKLNTLPHI